MNPTNIPSSDVSDLAFDNGILYAATGYNLYWIDQNNGNATFISDISTYGSIYGLTAIEGVAPPVPEPVSMLLYGTVLYSVVGISEGELKK